MKYLDMFPIVPAMEMLNPKRSLLMGHEEKPCAICKDLTPVIDVCWETHICSEECERQMVQDYNRACYLSDVKNLDGNHKKWPNDVVYQIFCNDDLESLPVGILTQMIEHLKDVRRKLNGETSMAKKMAEGKCPF